MSGQAKTTKLHQGASQGGLAAGLSLQTVNLDATQTQNVSKLASEFTAGIGAALAGSTLMQGNNPGQSAKKDKTKGGSPFGQPDDINDANKGDVFGPISDAIAGPDYLDIFQTSLGFHIDTPQIVVASEFLPIQGSVTSDERDFALLTKELAVIATAKNAIIEISSSGAGALIEENKKANAELIKKLGDKAFILLKILLEAQSAFDIKNFSHAPKTDIKAISQFAVTQQSDFSFSNIGNNIEILTSSGLLSKVFRKLNYYFQKKGWLSNDFEALSPTAVYHQLLTELKRGLLSYPFALGTGVNANTDKFFSSDYARIYRVRGLFKFKQSSMKFEHLSESDFNDPIFINFFQNQPFAHEPFGDIADYRNSKVLSLSPISVANVQGRDLTATVVSKDFNYLADNLSTDDLSISPRFISSIDNYMLTREVNYSISLKSDNIRKALLNKFNYQVSDLFNFFPKPSKNQETITGCNQSVWDSLIYTSIKRDVLSFADDSLFIEDLSEGPDTSVKKLIDLSVIKASPTGADFSFIAEKIYTVMTFEDSDMPVIDDAMQKLTKGSFFFVDSSLFTTDFQKFDISRVNLILDRLNKANSAMSIIKSLYCGKDQVIEASIHDMLDEEFEKDVILKAAQKIESVVLQEYKKFLEVLPSRQIALQDAKRREIFLVENTSSPTSLVVFGASIFKWALSHALNSNSVSKTCSRSAYLRVLFTIVMREVFKKLFTDFSVEYENFRSKFTGVVKKNVINEIEYESNEGNVSDADNDADYITTTYLEPKFVLGGVGSSFSGTDAGVAGELVETGNLGIVNETSAGENAYIGDENDLAKVYVNSHELRISWSNLDLWGKSLVINAPSKFTPEAFAFQGNVPVIEGSTTLDSLAGSGATSEYDASANANTPELVFDGMLVADGRFTIDVPNLTKKTSLYLPLDECNNIGQTSVQAATYNDTMDEGTAEYLKQAESTGVIEEIQGYKDGDAGTIIVKNLKIGEDTIHVADNPVIKRLFFEGNSFIELLGSGLNAEPDGIFKPIVDLMLDFLQLNMAIASRTEVPVSEIQDPSIDSPIKTFQPSETDKFTNGATAHAGMPITAMLWKYFIIICKIVSNITPDNFNGLFGSEGAETNLGGYSLSPISAEDLKNIFKLLPEAQPGDTNSIYPDQLNKVVTDHKNLIIQQANEIDILDKFIKNSRARMENFRKQLSQDFTPYIGETRDAFAADNTLTDIQKISLANLSFTPDQLILSSYMLSELNDRINNSNNSETILKTLPEFSSFPKGFIDFYPINDFDTVSCRVMKNFFKTDEFLNYEGGNKKILCVGLPSTMIRNHLGLSNAAINSYYSDAILKRRIIKISVYKNDILHPGIMFDSQDFLFDVYRYPTRIVSNWGDLNNWKSYLDTPSKYLEGGGFVLHKNFSEVESMYKKINDFDSNEIFYNFFKSFALDQYFRWFSKFNVDETRYYNYRGLTAELKTLTEQFNNYTLAAGGTTIFNAIETNTAPADTTDIFANAQESVKRHLRNETLLLSPTTLKQKVLYPKKFDRVFNVIFDPDDFKILTVDENLAPKYIAEGIISGAGTPLSPYVWSRKTQQIDITMDEYWVSIEPFYPKL